MNVGLIGLGRHGMRYAHHLLDSPSPARLVAICRRDSEKGHAFADKHQLRFHRRPQDLASDPEVDAVIVVTPPSLTLPIAMDAIQHRKAVLIEKPLSVTAADARKIVETSTKAGVPIMTAHTMRYDATIAKLKECSENVGAWRYLALTARLERRLPSIEEIQAWKGRGALLEFGIHLLDLARFLTGEEITEVHCEVNRTDIDKPEEQIWGRLTTQSGIPCLLDVSRVSSSRMTRVELIGETGQVRANWTTGTVSLQRERHPPEEYTLAPTPTIQRVLEDFVHALTTGSPMPIPANDGLRAVEIAEACYESARTGSPVQSPHYSPSK